MISDQTAKNIFLNDKNGYSPMRSLEIMKHRIDMMRLKEHLSKVRKLKENKAGHSIFAGMRPHVEEYRASLEKREKVIKTAIDDQIRSFDMD